MLFLVAFQIFNLSISGVAFMPFSSDSLHTDLNIYDSVVEYFCEAIFNSGVDFPESGKQNVESGSLEGKHFVMKWKLEVMGESNIKVITDRYNFPYPLNVFYFKKPISDILTPPPKTV
ncbi:MAG: hypothetical protein IKD55_10065 [Sediminibacterium sp.]|nr:hypothetical protein [Sediminibacterium sp.]